jgi:NAD(P)-dependent dehydrogenase (short-subunit alcohol dehydrogenase family)
VVAADIVADRATSTTAEIRAAGAASEAVTMDVSRREDVTRTLEVAIAAFGRIHILVSVAGIATVRPYEASYVTGSTVLVDGGYLAV